jgi:trimethylamine--corrinoid protein Co-methyltransferase
MPMTSHLPLAFLAPEEVEAIHQATLRILDEVGVVLAHPQGREILSAAGARVFRDRIHLPPDLVESQVARCPHTVTLRGRDGKAITLGDGSLHWHNLGGARDVYEPPTGDIRPATLQDVRDSARLLDALPRASAVTPFFTPQDVAGKCMSLAMYRHTLPCTTKPVHGPGVQTEVEVAYLARMAAVIGPPSEVLSLGISPLSPLTFPDDITAAILETARQGIPLGPLPCPTAGATAPLSLAGALAQQNAEVLAMVVLAQLAQPGLPIFYCGRLAMLEPRSGTSVWGGVELGLASAATVQIGHRYGLPVNVYGLSTNAFDIGLQSGYERALNAVAPALAGADELSGIGEMAAGVMGSYAQMVIDDEIAGSVQRLRSGIRVDPDSLAVEMIARSMDGARNFLGEPHTKRYLRAGELFVTRLAERGGWQSWVQAGRQGMLERAQADAERLLKEHEVPPLDDEQEIALDAILKGAEINL